MPGRSSRSRAKSIRFQLCVWAEVSDTAEKHGVTFNEEVIRRLRLGADPDWSRGVTGEQPKLFDDEAGV